MAFVRRLLDVQFTKGEGTFYNTGANTLRISGLRITASIAKSAGIGQGQARIVIYGLTLDQMNQLSTLGQKVQTVSSDSITILAGDDDGSEMCVVFIGDIFDAYADMQGAPEVNFQVGAQTALADAVILTKPTSFRGGVSAGTVAGTLAQKMGLTLENSGIDAKLASPYLWGSPLNQLLKLAQAANFNFVIDNGVLAIWPRLKSRETGTIPIVSASSGMIGYPSYTAAGISVKSIFNPAIVFGSKIEVRSTLKLGFSQWRVQSVTYDLESENPGGPWEQTMFCTDPDYGTIIPTG